MILWLLVVAWPAISALRADSNSIPDSDHSDFVFYDMGFNDVSYETPANVSSDVARSRTKKCGLRTAYMSGDLAQHLPSKSVLLLGCSLDINALIQFCASVASKLHGNPFEGEFCKAGNFTMAMLFVPGSGEPPYFSLYSDLMWKKHLQLHPRPTFSIPSTHDIITKKAPVFTQSIMGAQPDLVVVDDSLWSLSKWWEHNGGDPNMPFQGPFPTPSKELQQWCNEGLKLHMDLVAANYPNSRIAFRTAPTVVKPISGQTAEILEIMNECIAAHTHGDLLFGKFPVIRYHEMVDRMMTSSKDKGESVEHLYCDENHPGPEISLAYAKMVADTVMSPVKS